MPVICGRRKRAGYLSVGDVMPARAALAHERPAPNRALCHTHIVLGERNQMYEIGRFAPAGEPGLWAAGYDRSSSHLIT